MMATWLTADTLVVLALSVRELRSGSRGAWWTAPWGAGADAATAARAACRPARGDTGPCWRGLRGYIRFTGLSSRGGFARAGAGAGRLASAAKDSVVKQESGKPAG